MVRQECLFEASSITFSLYLATTRRKKTTIKLRKIKKAWKINNLSIHLVISCFWISGDSLGNFADDWINCSLIDDPQVGESPRLRVLRVYLVTGNQRFSIDRLYPCNQPADRLINVDCHLTAARVYSTQASHRSSSIGSRESDSRSERPLWNGAYVLPSISHCMFIWMYFY